MFRAHEALTLVEFERVVMRVGVQFPPGKLARPLKVAHDEEGQGRDRVPIVGV